MKGLGMPTFDYVSNPFIFLKNEIYEVLEKAVNRWGRRDLHGEMGR